MQRSIIAPAERVTNLRWGMLAIVAALILAVSVDGVALVLGGWTNLDRLAFVTGAVVAQLPAGIALDRFGVRRTGIVAAIVWIAGSLAAGFASGATIAASAVVGAAASAFLPLAIKASASWFPQSERSRATAIVLAAANAPIVVTLLPFAPKFDDGTPLLAVIAFVAVVTLVFALAYRDADDARVTYAERTFISDGGAQPVVVTAPAAAFAQLARQRSVWGLAFAFGAFSFAFGLGAVQIWGVAFAWFALLVTLLIGGAQVDALARGGGAGARVRTLVLVAGSLCGCASIGILGANPALGLACTAIALFGFSAAQPVAWSIPGFIAPPGAVGLLASIVALAGTLGSALAWLEGVDTLGAAIAALIAAALFAFALDRIEPIREPV